MKGNSITQGVITEFKKHLEEEEKSAATIEKYVRDVDAFSNFTQSGELSKETVIRYKRQLCDEGYTVRSINSMLASLNSFFCFINRPELKVKSLKIQQQVFVPEEKELTRAEYERLCHTALEQKNERLYLILQTICSTGIRVSELSFVTVEAVKCGKVEITLKGKIRVILLVKKLQKKLMKFIQGQKITKGSVFISRNGRPIGRTSVWREMKGLCDKARVKPQKVFPHNLRHLFARVFYEMKKDIVRLADILGHSSINTTRIYIISTGLEHRHCMEKMRLIL